MTRILVIDDDVNLLQMVRLMLERVGHEVETANNGQRGIVVAGQSRPDLAIIDVMMPELNGYDVVSRLREDPSTARLPIIILTARSQPIDKQMALDAGANSFLSKPVTAKELTDRVSAVLEAGVDFRVHTGPLVEPVPASAPDAAESLGAPVIPAPTPPPGFEDEYERPPSQPRPPEGLPGRTPSRPPSQPRPPEGLPGRAPSRTPSRPRSSGRLPIGAEDIDQAADIRPSRLPVMTVLSLRGGTGCTTVAVNLAVMLAAQGRRVCLTDLSTTGGHIQLHVHFTVQQGWDQLLSMGDMPDPRAINQLLIQHPSTNLSVLPAPPLPTPQTLSQGAMQNVLRELITVHNPVIVDAGTLDPATTGALTVSGRVIVVMSDDPASVQTTGQTLLALQKMGIDAGQIRVVLNHVRPQPDVPAATIQKALKRPLSGELPFDTNHSNAIRRGVPLVIMAPNGPFSQAMQQILRTLVT